MHTITLDEHNKPNATVQKLSVEPEFGRVQDVQKIFGVKRGILYRWIKENKIKSVSITEPGSVQGIRLIHLGSVREYLSKQFNGG